MSIPGRDDEKYTILPWKQCGENGGSVRSEVEIALNHCQDSQMVKYFANLGPRVILLCIIPFRTSHLDLFHPFFLLSTPRPATPCRALILIPF